MRAAVEKQSRGSERHGIRLPVVVLDRGTGCEGLLDVPPSRDDAKEHLHHAVELALHAQVVELVAILCGAFLHIRLVGKTEQMGVRDCAPLMGPSVLEVTARHRTGTQTRCRRGIRPVAWER